GQKYDRFWNIAQACGTFGQRDQEVLGAEARLSFLPARRRVVPIAVEKTGFNIVGKISTEDFIFDPLLQSNVKNGAKNFNPFIEVARHPIGTGNVNLLFATVFE